jgi:serine/threonine-protein phosphatase 2A catalytic subunit
VEWQWRGGCTRAAIMEVDEVFAMVDGDAVYEHCKFSKFDPAPREDNWRHGKRQPDYFL